MLRKSFFLVQQTATSSSSRRIFPTVVMPTKPWKKPEGNTMTHASSSTQQLQEGQEFPTRTSAAEDERVISLGNRVRTLLSQKQPEEQQQQQQHPPPPQPSISQASLNDEMSQVNAVSQMINAQQQEQQNAENMLRGGAGAAPDENISPELAWANRILASAAAAAQDANSSSSLSSIDDPAVERQAAMRKFIEMEQAAAAAAAAESKTVEKSGEDLLRQLRDSQADPLSEQEHNQLVNWIDGFVSRSTEAAGGDDGPKAADDDSSSEKKQVAFSHALRDAARLLDSCGFQRRDWFIACGTALGATREEGKFILHDTDIDLGLFYREGKEMGDHFSDSVLRLIAVTSPATAAESAKSNFICFDSLGSLHLSPGGGGGGGGFQLRMMHLPSRVPIDINVHYPSNAAAEDGGKRRWWFAMFYINSEGKYDPSRGDAMRKCWFSENALNPENTTSSSCSVKMLSHGDGGGPQPQQEEIFCPNEQYLLEYFGEDWKTPKKYDYEEALEQGLFKNME